MGHFPCLFPIPHIDLNSVGAQSANLIFAFSPVPHRPNSSVWGLVLQTGVLPLPPEGLLVPLPRYVDVYFLESLPLTALRPRTDAVGAGGAADVMFTDQGFPSSLGEGLGPLIRHSYQGVSRGAPPLSLLLPLLEQLKSVVPLFTTLPPGGMSGRVNKGAETRESKARNVGASASTVCRILPGTRL